MRRPRIAGALACVALLAVEAAAQVRAPGVMRTPAATTPSGTGAGPVIAAPAATASLNWKEIPGCARALAASDAALWALGCDEQTGGYSIYRLFPIDGGQWTKLSGAAVRISVQENGVPWVVTREGHIYIGVPPRAPNSDPQWRRMEFRGEGPGCYRGVAATDSFVVVQLCREYAGRPRLAWSVPGTSFMPAYGGYLASRGGGSLCWLPNPPATACDSPLTDVPGAGPTAASVIAASSAGLNNVAVLPTVPSKVLTGHVPGSTGFAASPQYAGLDKDGLLTADMLPFRERTSDQVRSVAMSGGAMWAIAAADADERGGRVLRWVGCCGADGAEVAGTTGVSVAASPSGRVWVVDREGRIREYVGPR